MHFDPTAMRKRLAFPKKIEPVVLLVMGYPSDDAKSLDLHFNSSPIDETVFYEDYK